METKFTKGEWKVVNYGNCFGIEATLPNGQEHTVFTDQFCYASKFDGDAESNAKLIAAAPDLLKLAEDFCSTFKSTVGYQKYDNNVFTVLNYRYIQALKAIKKATE